MSSQPSRALAFRYVGALLVVAGLLVAGQLAVQVALDRQEGDSRVINIAGRQRMLGQRLAMLLLALAVEGDAAKDANLAELARVADEWERSQRALRGDATAEGAARFAAIADDHAVMLAAARGAIAARAADGFAEQARAHQDAFLTGMDEIVASYEQDARARVVRLRHTELALLVLVLGVLAFEGAFVFRPAVRGLRAYLAERDDAQLALLSVTDREQQRLAQDLHDSLGQHLVGVSFLVESMRQGGAASPERLDELRRLLAESIDQTRGLARGLYSQTLEVDGLAAALRELASHTERVFGIACRVAGDPVELPTSLRGHIYRIAREAVVNAAKHARAHAIDIELAADATHVTVIVRDDGIGIAQPARDGMGLRLMESRAKLIGATFGIAAGESRGTTVTCIAPLGARA